MSKELIDRIRKNRQIRVTVGALTFIARRPTDEEMVAAQGKSFAELGKAHVVGWEGFTEDTVAGGGGTDPVAFSADLWREVYADRPDWWEPISKALLDAYVEHTKAMDVAAKN